MDQNETKEEGNTDFSHFYDSPANKKARVQAADKSQSVHISTHSRQIILIVIMLLLGGVTAYLILTRPKPQPFVPPAGYEISYPKDGPPRLEKSK